MCQELSADSGQFQKTNRKSVKRIDFKEKKMLKY